MFTITKDKLADGDMIKSMVGIVGPSGCELKSEEIKNHPEAKEFRLLDDDGVIYYYGKYVGPDDESLFEPLDCFGMPSAGCTVIQYKLNNRWEFV